MLAALPTATPNRCCCCCLQAKRSSRRRTPSLRRANRIAPQQHTRHRARCWAGSTSRCSSREGPPLPPSYRYLRSMGPLPRVVEGALPQGCWSGVPSEALPGAHWHEPPQHPRGGCAPRWWTVHSRRCLHICRYTGTHQVQTHAPYLSRRRSWRRFWSGELKILRVLTVDTLIAWWNACCLPVSPVKAYCGSFRVGGRHCGTPGPGVQQHREG